MKRTILIILICFSATGCGQWYVDRYLHNNLSIPDLGITSAIDALQWVYFNIDYVSEGDRDRWQTPEYTYTFRTGDCEDFAILWMYLVEKQAGISGTYLVLVRSLFSPTLHALGWLDGWYYDCTGGVRFKSLDGYYSEIKRYDYDDSIKEAMKKNMMEKEDV